MPQRSAAPAAPPVRAVDRTSLAFAGLVFGAFVAYYSLACFHSRWVGDLQMYCAGVAELYRDLLHPGHEAMRAPGSQSTLYTIYLVVVAASGRLLGVSPYRALQLAGVTNLVLYSLAIVYFFSRCSMHRRFLVPAALFLLVSLFLRWEHFGWSSETSAATMLSIQAYPSTLGWALALACFGLMEDFLGRGRRLHLGLLAGAIWVLLLTHVLTAGWVVGITGLRALHALVVTRQWRRPAALLGAIAAAVLLTTAWPYYAFFGQASMRGISERARYGKQPFDDFFGLYLVAAPCPVWLLLRARRHGFWALGFVATLCALRAQQALGIDFGSRYTFFMAFFAQLAVAEVAACFPLGLAPGAASEETDRWTRADLAFAGLVLVAAVVVAVRAPALAQARQRGVDRLRSPFELARAPATHDAYYARWAELATVLGPADLVLMPVTRDTFDLASITGVRVVCSHNAFQVPGYLELRRDVDRVYSGEVDAAAAVALAQRHGANKVLVPARQSGLRARLTARLGLPVHQDADYTVFVLPAAPPPP
jgi:hypothetical protein